MSNLEALLGGNGPREAEHALLGMLSGTDIDNLTKVSKILRDSATLNGIKRWGPTHRALQDYLCSRCGNMPYSTGTPIRHCSFHPGGQNETFCENCCKSTIIVCFVCSLGNPSWCTCPQLATNMSELEQYGTIVCNDCDAQDNTPENQDPAQLICHVCASTDGRIAWRIAAKACKKYKRLSYLDFPGFW